MNNPTRRQFLAAGPAIIAGSAAMDAVQAAPRSEPRPDPGPVSIPMKAHPIRTEVVALRADDGKGWSSAVRREWKPGDAARCRRCPKCYARNDACMILVNIFVSEKDAPTLDLNSRGFTHHPSPAELPKANPTPTLKRKDGDR